MKSKRGLLVVHLLEDRVRLLAGTAGLWSSDIAQVADVPGDIRSLSARPEWSTALIREVEQFALRCGLKNPLAVVAIARGLLFWRTFVVPPVPRASLDGLIGFEVDKHLPSRREELLFRCLPLAQTAEGWTVLLAGTRRDLLRPVEEALEMLGLRPAAVLPDITGLVHLLLRRGQGPEGDTPALVRLDADAAEVAVLSEGLPLLYRRVALPPAPALGSGGAEPLADQLARAAGDAVAAIAGTLRDAAAVLPPGATVSRGFLFAETGSDLVLQRLPEASSLAWQALRPADLPSLSTPAGRGDHPRLLVTAGMALGAADASASPLNLLAAAVPPPRGRTGYLVAAVLATALAALVLLFAGSLDQRRQARLDELERVTAELKGQVEAVMKLSDLVRRDEIKLQALEAVAVHRVPVVNILRELTRVIPGGAYLTQVTIKKGTVELNGLADSASGLISQLEASTLFKNVSFDAPITSQGQKERFKIKLTLE